MTVITPRQFLEDLFRKAVAAAHPAQSLPALLPARLEIGRLIVLAAGKAAGSMAEVAERHYLAAGFPKARLAGIAVARHGYGRPLQAIEMVEAGHPMPDQAGPRRRRAHAGTRAGRDQRRPGAGADLGRRLGQLDRAGAGPVACGEAGGDARAASLRRQHHRDEHRAKASVADQGRTAGAPRPSGAARDASASPTCPATIRP